MRFRNYLAASAAGLAFTAVAAIEVQAQETTSAIRGMVYDDSGAAVGGATVTIRDERTGSTRVLTTDPAGAFNLQNLNVGGPYSIEVAAADYQTTQVDGVFVNLGDTASFDLTLTSGAAADRIVVTGAQLVSRTAIGPSATFGLETLQESPAINRDLKDILRQDPRIYLDESFNDSIQCAGAHPRFNSLTVDGVAMNDSFGLNSNGYPTERMPFPYDAISQVTVELAPYDVQYGGFTACNINAVTKSGTNEFHGSLFFDYTDDSLRGDSIEGAPVFVPSFDEKRYGGTIGGPIVEDYLFFFAAYEKFEGQNLFFRGPAGSGATNPIAALSQATYDEIVAISNQVYGYDPGGTPSVFPAEDEKYLIRVDANFGLRHRASIVYNYNSALNRTESDSNQATQFEFTNHLYNRGADLNAYSGQIFSDWTDNFSTEFRLGYNDVDFTQECLDGRRVGEVQLRFGSSTVFLGCDDSRHANDLDYTAFNSKLAANLQVGAHTLTAGYEYAQTQIFNLFIQHTEGEFVFSAPAGATNTAQVLTAFRTGQPSQIVYGNARGSNNPDDAAANFGYETHTLYLQDEFVWRDAIVTAGLRYDYYSAEDEPISNPLFLARNGFPNTFNLDGVDLLQPRLGVQWDGIDNLSLRGGIGLYSGGNPNVWISNSYSNDGVANIQITTDYRGMNTTGAAAALPLANILTTPNIGDERGPGQTVNPNGALWGIPTPAFNQVANGAANSTVNAIDPNFKAPGEWKFSLGGTYNFDAGFFGSDYLVNFDYLHSESAQGAIIKDIALQQVGTAPDGRPIYRRIDRSDPDCITNPGTALAANAACTYRGNNNDLLLTNSDGGKQDVISISLQKFYDFGLDWSAAYAFVDSRDVSSMTSSVAFSNWTSNAISDMNNPQLATSNYQIPHRFTGNINWEHAFFGDFMTRVSLFGQLFQARPYSYVYNNANSSNMYGDGNENIHLIYVPSGPGATDDPRVVYSPTFPLADFNAWIDSVGLERGAIAGRNAFDGQWNNKFDIRIEQEVPTGFGTRGSFFVTMENVGNFIDDDWGVLYQSPFPQRANVLDASLNAAGTQYVYEAFNSALANDPETRVGDVSFWTVRVGVDWAF